MTSEEAQKRGNSFPEKIEYVSCPFCGETGFDLIGLKMHFERAWCDSYEETPREDPKVEDDA